jgi:hypothetical protein
MAKRRLHRRYGRMGVGSAVVHSRMSLAAYEKAVSSALRGLWQKDTATIAERTRTLHGWLDGKAPMTAALEIEQQRQGKRAA